jgi:cytochrome c
VSRLRAAFICCALAVIVSLALARIHPFGNAGLYAMEPAVTAIPINSQIPPEVRAVLVEKCADCHSNQTSAPFYGRFAPVSWLMESDIVEARKAMNLSLWDIYPPEQQQTLAAKIVRLAKSHDMPPMQYRMIHWNARVTDADVNALAQWAHGPRAMLAATPATGAGDPAQGKLLFEKRCTGCHALTQNHQGPQLQSVYGRISGTAPGYAYSAALKKAHIVWDDASLDKWLTDPDAFISGNEMDFLVAKPQDRQDIISYLKQNSGR